MDILGKHSIGFNNLGVPLVADLERDLSLALTKGESQLLLIIEAKSVNYLSFNIGWSAKADLERAIAEQKELLQERQALVCTPNSPIGVAFVISLTLWVC